MTRLSTRQYAKQVNATKGQMNTILAELRMQCFDAALVARQGADIDDPRSMAVREIEIQLDAIRYQLHDLQD